MKSDKITIASFVISVLGLLIAIIAGFFNQFVASIVGIIILLLAWMSWFTAKVIVLDRSRKNQKTIVIDTTPPIPYKPYHSSFQDQIIKIDNTYKKVKIPATFLKWPRFTILFWVEITEEFFRSHNNKYLFSYTTNVKDVSEYPNAFFLSLVGNSTKWGLVIKGSDPQKAIEKIKFESGNNLLGWKLFSVRWHLDPRTLDFSIDTGRVYRNIREIPIDSWPEPDPNCEFHLGGWQDNWHGGLSELRFYNFRIFDKYLSDEDIETVFDKEHDRLITS
jgi:hypothetical protein